MGLDSVPFASQAKTSASRLSSGSESTRPARQCRLNRTKGFHAKSAVAETSRSLYTLSVSTAAKASLRIIAIFCFVGVLTLAVCQSTRKPAPEHPSANAPGDVTPGALNTSVDAAPPDAEPKKPEPHFFPATKAPGVMFREEPQRAPGPRNAQQAPR